MKKTLCTLCLLIITHTFLCKGENRTTQDNEKDRIYWINTVDRIARPVLQNLATETLKQNMPFESLSKGSPRFSYLEAVGRTLCGIAPWLELGPGNDKEGKLRAEYLKLVHKGLYNAVNPESPDYLIFSEPHQPLVDAAFLAEGLLRAPVQLWGKLDSITQSRLIKEWKSSRAIKPNESNWLLFASMVEAALLQFTGECDAERLYYGVFKFCEQWYKGDAQYGDGEPFHLDYYNSYVIHPMLQDILTVIKAHGMDRKDYLTAQSKRLGRYAEQLERFISPEGTFPAVGRSIVYRTGAFHALGQAALLHLLPEQLPAGQVRSAMTAVIRKQFASPHNFDEKGWLKVGFTGKQLEMSESYINTGSLYLCLTGFLPLGLPAEDPFWSEPYQEWTNLKAWSGKAVNADHSL